MINTMNGERIADGEDVDFLVIGSGIAGLTYALQTACHGSTLILTKKDRAESNSNYAQGGVAGAMSADDTISLHMQDTLTAGAGLCHADAVEVLVTEGPQRIRDLIDLGAHFSTTRDAFGREELALGREGGHSRNRIVHAVDRTGWECERTLLSAAKQMPNLEIHEHYFVIDLAMSESTPPECIGAFALDARTGTISLFRARAVLLASGGCGQVYLHTTNPAIATGDGVAMAWRAGAPVANMEFVQFHPTALYHPEGRSFLISEAVRGEGGILRTKDGSTFMDKYHPLGALAPRDVVARAIHAERLLRGETCVFLDVTHLDPDHVKTRFPTIYNRCLELGIDITREPIPVVPAAHYACGGVLTDLDGATEITGLYACGEVACTGVHGANRLASNSLLEAMVFGHRAARHAVQSVGNRPEKGAPQPLREFGRDTVSANSVETAKLKLKSIMNDHVGIVRNDRELLRASDEAGQILMTATGLISEFCPEPDLLELRNMADVAQIIVQSAIGRVESRGLHYNTNHPLPDDAHWRRDTILRRAA